MRNRILPRVASLVVVGLAAMGWGAAGGAEGAKAKRPPNILFILADDLGWGDLGCYGHPHIRTPNLDRLAAGGTLFTHFYVNASVCSPTRTAFMTGHYPARHSVHGHFASHEQNAARDMPDWLDPAVPTTPALLKRAGYATGHFGKWHLGSGQGAPPPDAYGFDDHRTVNSNGPGWDEPDSSFRAQSSAAIVDEAIRFVRAHRDQPFYLNVWSLVPHATLNPTAEQMAPYERFSPKGVPHDGALKIFYASVTDLDTQIGRLLDELDALGLADETLVLFSSDNGPEDIHITNASHSGVGSAGPFRGRKRSLYEGGIRVPGIVRWPGHVPAGRVDDSSVLAAVDLLPTACALAGVALPDGSAPDGEDLGDILRGTSRDRGRPLFWEWRFNIAGDTLNKSPMLAVRDGRWKLLFNPDRSRVELFDIPADPSQLANLADRESALVDRLAALALDWQRTLPPGHIDATAGRADYPWPTEAARPKAGRRAEAQPSGDR